MPSASGEVQILAGFVPSRTAERAAKTPRDAGAEKVHSVLDSVRAEPRANVDSAAKAGSTYVRGVGLGLFASDPDWNYGGMLREIADRGASDVLLVVNAFQRDRLAHDIALRPGHSPSQSTFARTLRQARELGLRVAVMPVVRLRDRGPGDWRGRISPGAGADAWFDAYRGLVLPLAATAEREGAARFYVGSELAALEPHVDQWRGLIAALRQRFSGTLSYSANWDRAHAVGFWDALDEIALTAYFPLHGDAGRPTGASIAAAWRAPLAGIDTLAARHRLPVVVSEVGYASQPGAAMRPWDDRPVGGIDLALQAQLYAGFCDAFDRSPAVRGFYAWNWFGVGGPRDPGYSPRGKPAAAVLGACFARARAADRPQARAGGTPPRRRARATALR